MKRESQGVIAYSNSLQYKKVMYLFHGEPQREYTSYLLCFSTISHFHSPTRKNRIVKKSGVTTKACSCQSTWMYVLKSVCMCEDYHYLDYHHAQKTSAKTDSLYLFISDIFSFGQENYILKSSFRFYLLRWHFSSRLRRRTKELLRLVTIVVANHL